MTDNPIVAYCVKCKAKRQMQDPQPVYTENGRPGTRGRCPVCGATMFRLGKTPAHAGLPKPDPPKREGKLVIVESPAKARTVGRFLGKGYTVKASIGHVRDLLRSRLAVDIANDFKPTYRIIKEKREVVKELAEAAKRAAEVYLATDPDREGEAIAWHLMEAAKIDKGRARRVVFHEITRHAIEEAFAHPRGIDRRLVNAQQARRILDRLVGYTISPLLWKKVKNRLSAGRVQSVALRLVVEREREIQSFVPQEYWTIEAELAKRRRERLEKGEKRESFIAKLHRIRGQKVDLKSEEETQRIVQELERATYVVTKVKRREKRRHPAPPFITSTMQRAASNQLHFGARRTMVVAQQLYEGIELGEEGTVGLITYMRTDSVNVAASAQEEARAYIAEKHGQDYVPPKPRQYKTKVKGAQEAHEAIRPTSVWREPWAIKKYLTRDQYLLYDLIWRRFVASQMASAIFDTTSVDITAGPDYLFRATGSVVKFPGFLAVYRADEEEKEKALPPLSEGGVLDLVRLIPEQHFTQPPPRYTEASLIKALEEYGIGRPSTYAPIITTIQTRGYVEQVDRRLVPTELGFIVNDLLVEHFPEIMDVGFTAKMEEDLDAIARGERDWVPVLREFWGPFQRTLEQAKRNMPKVEVADQPTGEFCEKCGAPMVVKWGRYGKFIACSNFPECRNTKPYFEKIGVKCPECGGDLVVRKTRKGRTFYGCANYPECNFATWQRPLPEPCPHCGGLLTMVNKERAKCIKCGEVVKIMEIRETTEMRGRRG